MPGIKGTMEEYKAGTLHSGSKTGPKVKSRKQAIAIGLAQERRAGNPVAPKAKAKSKTKKKAKHAYYNEVKKAGLLDY